MKLLNIYLWLAALLFATACTDRTEEIEPVRKEYNICLQIGNKAPETRGELAGSEPDLKAVKRVWLYIFEGNNATSVCMYRTALPWDSEKLENKFYCKADLLPEKTYTFLVVGSDRRENDTYNLPDCFEIGTPLQEVIARVVTGKTKEDIRTSEIFAGQTEVNVPADGGLITTSIWMTRKVCGIFAYLRNIPAKIDAHDVKRLRVCLHSAQNTAMPLWKANDNAQTFGSEPLDGDDKVLFSWDLSTMQNDGTSILPDITYDGIATLPHTLFKGAYLIPLENNGTQRTLRIELCDENDNVLKTYYIKNKKEQSETNKDGFTFSLEENKLYGIGKKPSTNDTSGDEPADLSGSFLDVCLNNWIDFNNIDHIFSSIVGPARIVNYPFGPDYIHNCYTPAYDIEILDGKLQASDGFRKPGWELSVEYNGNQQFPGTEKLTDWVHFGEYDAEGKLVRYANRITSSGDGKTVRVILNDYAVKRMLQRNNRGKIESGWDNVHADILTPELVNQFKDDYREATLVLKTDGIEKPFKLTIRQYNAITIKVPAHSSYSLEKSRAVSRLDLGAYFDPMTGKPVHPTDSKGNDLTGYAWGYFSSNSYDIYRITGTIHSIVLKTSYDGEYLTQKAYNNYIDNVGADHAWIGSALEKTKCPETNLHTVTQGNTETVEEVQTERMWFLPAYQEMWEFSNMLRRFSSYNNIDNAAKNNPIYKLFDIGYNAIYWTATVNDLAFKSFRVHIGQEPYQDPVKREKIHRIRPMRKFDNPQKSPVE